MNRFPPPYNDRDKLRGNDGANCNLSKKLSYCTNEQKNQGLWLTDLPLFAEL
ncbi:hypothetical protein [Marivirga lumbricoides]|uniref:hypothetical protein n=1 Tax=Marivirga lumbricoides TaxID=1046115 RepID=UPI001666F1AD